MANTLPDQFPTSVAGLPAARAAEVVELADGARFDLRIAPVAKRLGDGDGGTGSGRGRGLGDHGTTVRMLAYNGSIPGPTLLVGEGSEVVVDVENQGDVEATVHWHGLRLENRYDGTHETQRPVAVGETFSARVTFPDPGVYWYHPHIREDYGQELGLYGNVLVEPADPDYWPPAHSEVLLTLDDVLLESDLSLRARPGEVVRLYLTNTANTRVFKVALPGAPMKLVGGDSGRVEREEIVDHVVLAPSERAVVDVLFDGPRQLALEHRTPDRVYRLVSIEVGGDRADPPLDVRFAALRTNADMAAERQRITPYLQAEPDKVLSFLAEMDLGAADRDGPTRYSCPMHPEMVSERPNHCPKCGMKLLPEALVAHAAANGHDHHAGTGDAAAGIEWEDDMVEINRMTTPANLRWKLVDGETGAENHFIDWRFRVGDQVKIRLLNEVAGDHPMHHPFHVHGAGRFLVLERDGVTEPNLVWKDTVLVRTGETVDILLDVSNVGRWMAHCHIAEHHETGMMFSFTVAPATAPTATSGGR